jgi:hypothetical protein
MKNTPSKPANDSTGHVRGAKGYGAADAESRDFLKPDFNDAKLYRATDGQAEVANRAHTGDRFGLQGKNGENRR